MSRSRQRNRWQVDQWRLLEVSGPFDGENYTFAERTFVSSPFQQEHGSFIRTQLQWNY